MAKMISRYLDTVGDGSGTKNANGDYSESEEIFFITPSAGSTYDIARMIVSVYDTTGMQAQEYGNLATALDPGIVVRVSNSEGVINDLTDGVPITTNSGWGALCYDVDVKSWGSGNELLVVRWTFAKSGVDIHLSLNEKLEVVLNDDFQGLLSHQFMVQGVDT
jgi:hypothetical protein